MSNRVSSSSVKVGQTSNRWWRLLWISTAIITLWMCFQLASVTRHGVTTAASASLRMRTLVETESDCHLVNAAKDRCQWVQEHCADEEAGLISYLQLYYCDLRSAKPVAILIIVFWLCMLFATIGIAASDFFSVNLSTISTLLGLSEDLAGVTFLAIGNGSPDVFSTFAAMSTNSGSMAIGELIGAAGFITAVVAGTMACIRPFQVSKGGFVRDVSFFICACALTMGLLADGQILMWECILMVAFYLCYVIVVVIWHWVEGKRNARRARESRARGHFLVHESLDTLDPSRTPEARGSGDDVDGRTPHSTLDEYFSTLEATGRDPEDDDSDTHSQQQALTEINRNMRVSRSVRRSRRPTANPIRPSLVGALEFRAVMTSLQHSRNHPPTPIYLRRYSDDPTHIRSRRQEFLQRNASNPEAGTSTGNPRPMTPSGPWPPYHDTEPSDARNRERAVSVNDAGSYDQQPSLDFQARPPHRPGISLSLDTQNVPRGLQLGREVSSSQLHPESSTMRALEVPLESSPIDETENQGPLRDADARETPSDPVPGVLRRASSGLLLAPGTAGSSPAAPFPMYQDEPTLPGPTSRSNSFKLPPPTLDLSMSVRPDNEPSQPFKRWRWWPYSVLPEPEVFFATLFPTLYRWSYKSALERLLGIMAAPSVLLLTITLPVVEEKPSDDASELDDDEVAPGIPTFNITTAEEHQTSPPLISVQSPSERSPLLPNGSADESDTQRLEQSTDLGASQGAFSSQWNTSQATTEPQTPMPEQGWNRWLFCVQIFMAPFFVILILWANTDDDYSLRTLAIYVVYGLIGSLAVLGVILSMTDPIKPPKWRPLACFAGFVVSVAWISTIANEVVGVLKALGIIFGISEAILGLTVFAVGNSLGDLVANITIARLGYPVMAFSACIGGPMLNILLGIGLGGTWHTAHSSGHHDVPLLSRPFEIEVGSTLLVSCVTLLITLAGLLIGVPLNKWRMDRRIGVGLLTLWCVATTINLILEVRGLGGPPSKRAGAVR